MLANPSQPSHTLHGLREHDSRRALKTAATHLGIPLHAHTDYCLLEFTPLPHSHASHSSHTCFPYPFQRIWLISITDTRNTPHYCFIAQFLHQGRLFHQAL